MVGSKVVQFFLLISSMIVSTHAQDLHVLFTNGKYKGFSTDTNIKVRVDAHGVRNYNGMGKNRYFRAPAGTEKVIVYIKEYNDMKATTLNDLYINKVKALAIRLNWIDYQLLFLGIEGFQPNDQSVIGEFVLRSIKLRKGVLLHNQIVTIGEGDFNLIYTSRKGSFFKYEETHNGVWEKLQDDIKAISA